MFWALLACFGGDSEETAGGDSESVTDTADTETEDSGSDDTGTDDTGDTGPTDTGPGDTGDPGIVAPTCPGAPVVTRDWYLDADGDGFGVGAAVSSDEVLEGYALRDGDCDDGDSTRSPSSVDWHLDGIDQDCDGADACDGATRVAEGDTLDCSLGLLVAEGNLTELPSGGCLCAIEGDLALAEESLDSDWAALEIIQGGLTGPLPSALPALTYVGSLSIDSPSSPIDLSHLRAVDILLIDGDLELVDLSSLAHAEIFGLDLTSQFSDIDLPSMQTMGGFSVRGSAGSKRMVFPRLQEVGKFYAWQEMPIEELDLGVGSSFGELWLSGPLLESFVLPPADKASIALPNVQCIYTSKAPAYLALAGDSQAVLLPNLESTGFLSVLDMHLFAPELTAADSMTLGWYSSLTAESLDSVTDLVARSTTLNSPPLDELNSLVGSYSTLPGIGKIGTLAYTGDLPSTSEVSIGIEEGSPWLPLLTELTVPANIERGSASTFPALETTTEGIKVTEGEALFPALTSGQLLHVDNVSELFVPQDASLTRLRIDNGLTALALPDPVTYGVAFSNHRPEAAAYGVFEKGLSYESNNRTGLREGLIEIDTVKGNVQIQAEAWTEHMLVVYEIGGNLEYCAPDVPEADRAAWLALMQVDGTVTNTCP